MKTIDIEDARTCRKGAKGDVGEGFLMYSKPMFPGFSYHSSGILSDVIQDADREETPAAGRENRQQHNSEQTTSGNRSAKTKRS